MQEYNSNTPLVAFVSSRLLFLIASAQPKTETRDSEIGTGYLAVYEHYNPSLKQSDRSEIEPRNAGARNANWD